MDERFSLWDSELGVSITNERVSFVNRWIERQPKTDPTPRKEVARVFFRDATHAHLHVH
ncbi:MAG: hypothetical protein ACXWUG_22805 [Polyangiales bacterium]